MTVTRGEGNLLQADVDALVNTVNTVGIMGKGIALQFKRAFPAMFSDYQRAARSRELTLGRMHVWPTQQMTGPRFVINFPTKGHWKARSRLEDIAAGLDALIEVIRERHIVSVALPPLGCGNGGLDWRDVEPLMIRKLSQLDGVDIVIYPPNGAPVAADMPTGEAEPGMTPGRAALVSLMSAYATYALATPSLIETQKLVYFLQVAGEPLRLNFVKHHYGPYADNLRHVLAAVEGHYLSGYGDGSSPVREAEPLTVMPGALDGAQRVLAAHPETQERIARVLELTSGFESAYGLELLASVHWLTHEDPLLANDPTRLTDAIRTWNPRKRSLFETDHVRVALHALRDRGWAEESVSA